MAMYRFFAVLLALSVVLGSARTRAASSEALDAEEAKEATSIAKKFARAGAVGRALPYFQRAYDLKATFVTAGNLGTAELKLSHYRAAAEHLDEALRQLPVERGDVQQMLEDKLAEAKRHILTLSIEAKPRGAVVYLDDEPIGVAPLTAPVFVDPGAHTVRATVLSLQSDTKMVRGRAGERQGVHIVARPAVAETLTPAAESTQQLQSVQDDAGDVAEAGADGLRPEVSVAIAGSSLTLASLGVSIGLTAWANDAAADGRAIDAQLDASSCSGSSLTTLCHQRDALQAEQDRASQAAFGMWVTTGSLAIATPVAMIAALLLEPSGEGDTPPINATLVPQLGPERGGVMLVGRW